MNPLGLWMLGLLLSPGTVQALTFSPHDFAYGAPVVTVKEAAAYRFALPIAVYQSTYREDLGDLRLFNAQGDAVPYSLLRPAAQSSIHKAAQPLLLFPLRQGSRIVIDGVRLSIDSPGSAVKLQTQNGGTVDTAVNQYILDQRALDASISALQLQWPEAAGDYSGRVRIEASDDLGSWRTVVAAAPIANLHANGQALIENRVAFAPAKAKFWRVSWLGIAPSFELTSVLAEPADSLIEPVRAALDIQGLPDPDNAAGYSFDLGAHPPVTRVNVLLPEANAVAGIELSSRSAPRDPWRPVTQAAFYRLKTPDGEQQNSPLEISADADRYWHARITGSGNLPHTTPQLHVEWIPSEVTFLAQGQAPFLLVYGNATATRAEADLSHLPASLEIAPATLGSPQLLGGPIRLVARPAPFPWTRAMLWSVLFLAVILLAWMAYGLSKETTETP
jgi:Protein of unknown function (DUF3999)